jgi:hypothetical protein
VRAKSWNTPLPQRGTLENVHEISYLDAMMRRCESCVAWHKDEAVWMETISRSWIKSEYKTFQF